MSSRARTALAAASLLVLAAPAAGAATATTRAAGSPIFCAQLANSRKAIAGVSKTAKDRNAKIAAEWAKIDRFAPAALKKDTAAMAAAYAKAAKQTAAAASATVGSTTAAGKRITDFAAKSCATTTGATAQGGPGGPGGRGDDDGDHGDHGGRPRFDDPAFQACLKTKGVTLPPPPQRDQAPQGQPPQGQQRGPRGDDDHGGRPEMDEATHNAVEACMAQTAVASTTTLKA